MESKTCLTCIKPFGISAFCNKEVFAVRWWQAKTPPHLFTEYERRVLASRPNFFEHRWIMFPTLSLAHFQESHIGKVFNFFCLFLYFPFPFTFLFLPPFLSLPFSSFLLGTGKRQYVENHLYSYPLIGSRIFCKLSFKESERQRGNCVALTGAALLPHRLTCVQSRAEIHLCENAQTHVRPMGITVLACSQVHLKNSRLAGVWLWWPRVQPRKGQKWNE